MYTYVYISHQIDLLEYHEYSGKATRKVTRHHGAQGKHQIFGKCN